MQIFKLLFVYAFIFIAGINYVYAQQDSTGLPGDHFSLQGALEMFKKAGSPEEFEKLINLSDQHVNNLDLDQNGEVDYISVINKSDLDAHVFILQVAVSASENQDIAVLELEKTGDTTAILQIVGEEEIFGEQIIVEASDQGDEMEDENPLPGRGPSINFDQEMRMVVNVFYWPTVRFVYSPVYVPWASPWRWQVHPRWWKPWRPFAWRVYHPLRLRHHKHCVIVRTHRVLVAHRVYTPYRVGSLTVRNRNTVARNNYKITRTTQRTAVTGPRGNTHIRKTQTTTIQKRGNANIRNNKIVEKENKGRGRRKG